MNELYRLIELLSKTYDECTLSEGVDFLKKEESDELDELRKKYDSFRPPQTRNESEIIHNERPMNELERELLEAMGKVPLIRNEDDMLRDDYEGYAEACAKVCLRWIEKGFDAGWMAINDAPYWTLDKERENWLKENNLIPTEKLSECNCLPGVCMDDNGVQKKCRNYNGRKQ